ncbi:hypothetical protein B7Y94_00945 [Candidatus Saccharibacteria bacterium 32-49-12]|nr:MAG: hypothetical protein B7Y94_00945 [Candidatus Saccharibacteria bacterium 32-49-12]
MERREKAETTRQYWEELSEFVQDDVNRVLKDLSLDVERANYILAEASSGDPEQISKLAVDIVNHLDSQWEYIGDHFLVAGKWQEPAVKMNNQGILVEHQEKEAFNQCVSNGFMVKPGDGDSDEPPRVGLSFIVADFPYSSDKLQGSLQLLAFADLDQVSLQYLRSAGDFNAASSDIEEVKSALFRADSTLSLYTTHQESSFYRQSAKKQENFLRSIVESVHDVLPAPSSLDKLIINDAVSQEFYIRDSTGPGLMHVISDETPFKVTGQVVGVAINDLVAEGPGRQFKSPDDLMSAQTGICLMVQPHTINFTINNYTGDYFLIPMRKLESIDFELK